MRRLLFLTMFPLALALAACGGSGNNKTSAAAATSTSASSSSAAGAYGPSTTSASGGTSQAALITTKHSGKLGTVLAFGPKKLTVYLFEADARGKSNCSGNCVKFWPPVTGSPKAVSGAASADLGTLTRSDGTKQVTYKGHPLYLFVKDKDDGDAYGEGMKAFGAEWYALSPSGSKIDES